MKCQRKNGTYYIEDDPDVLSVVNTVIDKSDDVPKDYKAQMKAWIHELFGISKMGWNNVSDMKLKYSRINYEYSFDYFREIAVHKPILSMTMCTSE